MRIERVVAGTFSEASERSRKLYGPDVLLLSSSQVGDVHELLLCTDATDINDEIASGDTAADTGFVAALHEQMQQRPLNARTERHREPTFSRPEAKPAESGADGASLVGLIRKEFLALERLLATGGVIPHGADQRMALLEQGVSAAYSGRLIDAGVDASSMAARLLADLLPDAAGERLGARPAVLVGPAAVGKTTVAMQTVLLIASTGGMPPVVSAARDPRIGARDRFFAMADAATCTCVSLPTATAMLRCVGSTISGRSRASSSRIGRPLKCRSVCWLRWPSEGCPLRDCLTRMTSPVR